MRLWRLEVAAQQRREKIGAEIEGGRERERGRLQPFHETGLKYLRERANLRAAVAPLLTRRGTLGALITPDLPKFTGIKVPLFHLRPRRRKHRHVAR